MDQLAVVIQTVIFAYRCEPNRFLRAWVDRNGLRWRFGSEDVGIERARNQELNRFLAEDVPGGATDLLMLDADIVPVPAELADGQPTDAVLTEPGDVLYCGYTGRDCTTRHCGDDDLGCGCLRISATCAAAVAKPAFAFPEDVLATHRTGCECAWFRRRCIEAGFAPRMVGLAGHRQEAIFIPRRNRSGWGLIFDSQLAVTSVRTERQRASGPRPS